MAPVGEHQLLPSDNWTSNWEREVNVTRPKGLVPYYVRGLALGVPIFLTAIHFWTWLLVIPASLRDGTLDFRQSYAAAHMLRAGNGDKLYDYLAQKEFQDRLVTPKAM